jgi:hypothetical protein
VERATTEIAIAVCIWVFGVGWLLDAVDVASWLQAAVVFGGAIALALTIAWWRVARYGPGVFGHGGGRRWMTGLPTPPTAMLFLSAALGGVMSALLLGQASSSENARDWGIVFGVLAVVQLVRALRRRGLG